MDSFEQCQKARLELECHPGAYNVGCAKLNAAECDRRRSQYAWKVHTALRNVSDIKSPMPNAMVANYEQGATVVSNRALRASGSVAEPKKIMVCSIE